MVGRRRRIGALFLISIIASITQLAPAGASAPPSGLVSASGTQLMLNGQPWRFVGYNMPCAQPFLLDEQQLQFAMADIANNSGANALRVWFFQQNGGPGNWGPFDRVVAAAQADGIRLIPTLVNEWAACEAPGQTVQKNIGWFQSGYTEKGDGYPLSYHDYAVAVAQHFAGNPTIAFWQLINEATAGTPLAGGGDTCDETAAAHALRSFADAMTAAIHTVDPGHLVSLGTLGGDQCGTTGSDYGYVHAGAIGICEYHDYSFTYTPLADDHAHNGLADELHQCQALGKPFFVGEAGIVPDVQPSGTQPHNCSPWPGCSPVPVTPASLNLRAQTFKQKITDAFAGGISGYLIWFKNPQYSAVNDSYAIGDGDPTEAVVRSLSLGGATPATLPPRPTPVSHHGSWTDSPLLAVVGGAVLLAIWIAMWRSRRRHRPGSHPVSSATEPRPVEEANVP